MAVAHSWVESKTRLSVFKLWGTGWGSLAFPHNFMPEDELPLGEESDHSLLYPRLITFVGLTFWHASVPALVGSVGIFHLSFVYIDCWLCKFSFALSFSLSYPIPLKLQPCQPSLESMLVLSLSLSMSTMLMYYLLNSVICNVMELFIITKSHLNVWR